MSIIIGSSYSIMRAMTLRSWRSRKIISTSMMAITVSAQALWVRQDKSTLKRKPHGKISEPSILTWKHTRFLIMVCRIARAQPREGSLKLQIGSIMRYSTTGIAFANKKISSKVSKSQRKPKICGSITSKTTLSFMFWKFNFGGKLLCFSGF